MSDSNSQNPQNSQGTELVESNPGENIPCEKNEHSETVTESTSNVQPADTQENSPAAPGDESQTENEIIVVDEPPDKKEMRDEKEEEENKTENKEEKEEEKPKKLKQSPIDYTNFLFKLTFEYATPLVWRGYWNYPLQEDDVWDLPKKLKAEHLSKEFDAAWEKRKNGKRPLLSTLNSLVGLRFIFAGFLKFISDCCNIMSPFIMNLVINAVKNDEEPWNAVMYSLILFATQLLFVLFINQYFYNVITVGVKIRSMLTAKVFQKALKLSNKSRSQKTIGEIVNLMSVDAQKLGEVSVFLHLLWSGFFQIFVILGFLIYFISWPALIGVAIMIILLPFQGLVIGIFSKLRRKVLKYSDKRIKQIMEVLQGIRVIKFFNWENSFTKKVKSIRNVEVKILGLLVVVRSVFVSIMVSSPVLVSVCTFLTYILAGNELQLAEVFTAIAYFNQLRLPLMFIVMVFAFVAESSVSLKRLQEFFDFEEMEPLPPGNDPENPVKVEHCTFEWEPKAEKRKKLKGLKALFSRKKKENGTETSSEEGSKDEEKEEDANKEEEGDTKKQKVGRLHDINFTLKKGELCCVVGSVGSGKSSLCQALIGEMKKIEGNIEITGKVAYCAQNAWIQNATVRDNILFGSEFDMEKYTTVVDVCALRADFKIFDHGDGTEIGEKGVTISGGQRQRIALARAVYNDADVFIFDDPLSAVDAHVGKHLFNECIYSYLKGKTRILVTHQLQYLKYADKIIVMEDGKIIEMGTYDELLNVEKGRLQQLIEEYLAEEKEEDREQDEKEKLEKMSEEKKRALSKLTEHKEGKILQEEERAQGAVSPKVYWEYAASGGGVFGFIAIPLILLAFIVAQVSSGSVDIWMSQWVKGDLGLSKWGYFGVYVGLAFLSFCLVFVRTAFFFTFGLISSTRLHSKALHRIIRAPMSYFDTTAAGRILSRFSKDQEMADTTLMVVISQVLQSACQLTMVLVIIVISSYWFLIPLIPCLILYFLIQQFYRNTSREIKRIESLTRSPLYAHFSESLTGLSTIRAYQRQDLFKRVNELRVDTNNRMWFAQMVSQRWLAFRLELLGAVLVLCASIFQIFGRDLINPEWSALAITYSLQITGFLGWIVTQFVEVETNMNAVERLLHFTKVENEPLDAVGVKVPKEWPQEGKLEFKDFKMRYRPGLPLVLKGLNITINGGEKIGIVGRTGAGKSSIILALYRMVEAAGGSIEIDGINIADVNLQTLRKRLSIIPQEPTLFTGTIRTNLDPFNEYDDKTLWDVLEKANMKAAIEKLDKKLYAEVVEGGENFSVGQRQLLCLARALCSSTKILVLDECTASVDLETDALIQQTIDREFSHCTRLTIAHRLNTIINSDRILVMDNGVCAEFDTPAKLLENENSIFSSLINETGAANARVLKAMAQKKSLSSLDLLENEEKGEIKSEQIILSETNE